MTRAEWIQQAVLQAMLSGETASPKETVETIVKIANVADALEKSNEAPWDELEPDDPAVMMQAALERGHREGMMDGAALEREACAKIADHVATLNSVTKLTAENIATTIRNRGAP